MSSSTSTSSSSSKRQCGKGPAPLISLNALVFDISGSTQSMGDAPVEQLHELMSQLQSDAIKDDRNIRLSLHVFDSVFRQIFPADLSEYSVDLRTFEIPSIDTIRSILRPRGMTALYDAGITGLDVLEKAATSEFNKLSPSVRKLKPYISKCFVLSTDGYDNSSHASISDFKRSLIKAKESGVQPLFLSANISTEMNEQMGFEPINAAQFQPTYDGMTQMLRATTNMLRQVSSGASHTIDAQSLTQNVSPQHIPITPSPPPLPVNYDPLVAPLMPGLGFGLRPPPLRRY